MDKIKKINLLNSSTTNNRINADVLKLINGKHEVIITGSNRYIFVKFHGPKDTPYENGVWRISVIIPDTYPFKPPIVSFVNRIYHPNIDEKTGFICLDVIGQTWTALYDLSIIFDMFLPQLLTYPNPMEPVNRDAALLLTIDSNKFLIKVAEKIKSFATEQHLLNLNSKSPENESSSLSELSDDETK